MNLNLRQAIFQRMQNKTSEDLHHVITDSIGGEDRVLPGLGVLFEIIWQHSDSSLQSKLVDTLKNNLP